MDTWQTYDMDIDDTEIRLETLDRDGKIAGWIVRRACNVFQAYLPAAALPIPEDGQAHDAVVDLLTDGRLVGQAGDSDGARQLIQDALGIEDTGERPALGPFLVEPRVIT
jgi:hypothetical protein